ERRRRSRRSRTGQRVLPCGHAGPSTTSPLRGSYAQAVAALEIQGWPKAHPMSPKPADNLAAIDAELRQGCEKVDSGRFRIDQKRALAKLRDYRLAEPHHYVLEFLRAAALSNARRVEVRTDSDDVEVRFDGDKFPPSVMRDVLSQALSGGKDVQARRARVFSLGVAGALGLKPRFVHIESSGFVVDLHPPDRVDVKEAKTPGGTFVHVKNRVGWWVLRNALLGSREAAAIKKLCRRYRCELVVDGERVDSDEDFTEPLLATAVGKGDGFRIAAALPERP